VNADDLGLHVDINRGIERAWREGLVTSASLVTCGEAFEHAVNLIQQNPALDIGIHFTLIEETPLSNLDLVPSLLEVNGRFHANYKTFLYYLLRGRISLAEIRTELTKQIEMAIAHGIKLSHIDSHQHVHMIPQIWKIIKEIALDYDISWVRNSSFDRPFKSLNSRSEVLFRLGLNTLSIIARYSSQFLKSPETTAGIHVSGHLTESDLSTIIADLRKGRTELVVHPGISTEALRSKYPAWHFDWSGELSATVSERVRQLLNDEGILLTNFAELAD